MLHCIQIFRNICRQSMTMGRLHYKNYQNIMKAMLHCIKIFRNICRQSMTMGRLHYKNYQYIMNICACACFESPHYLACFVICFPNIIKLLQDFIPYIIFYLCCKCSTFLSACTHSNAMKCSIENYLLYVQ